MKACQIMEELFALAPEVGKEAPTCDTLKAGDPEKEVRKVAVAMFGTPDILKKVSQWGAELLIVHEPLYYNHWDEHSDRWLEVEKRRLLESTGLTVYRFHDHPHLAEMGDMIALGELACVFPDAKLIPTGQLGNNRIVLSQPMTPREMAKLLEERLHLGHIKIAGAADQPCTKVSCMFGSPGGDIAELSKPECEMILSGELSEWRDLEFARDAAQLGYKKAILVLGHAGSEKEGMHFTARWLQQKHPELAVQYFDCGEAYTYTDK